MKNSTIFPIKKIFFHSLFSIYFLTTLNVMMYLHYFQNKLRFFNLVYESFLKNPWLSFQLQFLPSLLLVSSFLLWCFHTWASCLVWLFQPSVFSLFFFYIVDTTATLFFTFFLLAWIVLILVFVFILENLGTFKNYKE